MVNETSKAAEAYAAYRDLGASRSLAKLTAMWGKSETYVWQLERWCSQFSWVERAKTWDEEQREVERQKRLAEEDEKRQKQAKAVEDMNARHAQLGITQQLKMVKHVETLIAAKAFGSVATVQLLKLATELERLARGEATSIERSEGAVEVRVAYVNDWRQNSIDDTPPDAASGPDYGEETSAPVQLAKRRKKMA